MGFFSWNTADTDESIPAAASGRHSRPVYMLQPGGQPPIKEESYEGYGEFGGINAYEWLAKVNGFVGETDDSLRLLGINMQYLHVGRARSGAVYYCSIHTTEEQLKQLGVEAESFIAFPTYAEQIAVDGVVKEVNEHIAFGALVREKAYHVTYPLKFSFNPDAVYEDLPESTDCEYQGYFYED